MDFGGIYGWERSISWEDGAERGEGFELSTGNTDHPSTPPPTKHNLLLQRENFSLEVRLFELAPNLKIKSDI